MSDETPEPQITPYLLYQDVGKAMDWLAAAFGFEEFGERFEGPDGKVVHGAMRYGRGLVMMGWPGPDYRNPKDLGQATEQLYVAVDDVDAHYERARAAGAKILREPADQFYGDRNYGAEDPEGHHWYFAQHVRDVSTEEMKAAVAAMDAESNSG